MIGGGKHWEIVKKSRDLILSSRQLLQQLSGAFQGQGKILSRKRPVWIRIGQTPRAGNQRMTAQRIKLLKWLAALVSDGTTK